MSTLQCDEYGDFDTTVAECVYEMYEGDRATCCADPDNWDNQTICGQQDEFYQHCMTCTYKKLVDGTACGTGDCIAAAKPCQPAYWCDTDATSNDTHDCAAGIGSYMRNTYLREHVPSYCSVTPPKTPWLPSADQVVGTPQGDAEIQLFRGDFTHVGATEDSPGYHAYRFSANMDAIDMGAWGQYGLIAPGNFNHRITTIAVNVVGTDVINCSIAESPSTCAANPWLSYDLKQMGNVYIRNHHEDYNVQPFDVPNGIIRGGKAWVAEQVIGYPISSAHQGALVELQKMALAGRPLQGVYEIRIYDTPELVWNNVEDIQIVLGVHYWTKSE